MAGSICRNVTTKYCPRFGLLAVEMGFISEKQLIEALGCQTYEDILGRAHRLLGAILFDKGWMTSRQIDQVMTELLQRMRKEAA